MLLLILALLWVFGGVYCAIEHFRKDMNIYAEDVIPMCFFGALVGPVMGLFDCLEAGLFYIMRWYRGKVIIREKK